MKLLPRTGAHRRRSANPRHAMPLPRLSLPRPSLPKVSVPRLSRARSLWARLRGADQRPVERRRARALVLGSVAFAAIVLLSALPWSTLLDEHAQLSSDSAEVSTLQAQNRALADQARQLADTSTQTALARQDYGLVHPGQTAYDILPAPGTTPSNAVSSGHVPLDESPVVPGSRRSEQLLGAGVGTTATTGSSAGTVVDRAHAAMQPADLKRGAGGFWSRVGHTLEFWN